MAAYRKLKTKNKRISLRKSELFAKDVRTEDGRQRTGDEDIRRTGEWRI